MRRAVHDRLAGGPVDSRWWYWVAAVPATFAFWIVAVAWVAIAVGLGQFGDSNPIVRSGEISLVAFGVPIVVLTVVFPFAVYADASAVLDADLDWKPPRLMLAGAAAVGPLVVAATVLFALATDRALAVPLWAVVLGFLLVVPVASYYLYRRHDLLGVP